MPYAACFGNQRDFDEAANQEQHYCFGIDSQNEPFSHNTSVGNQGIRLRYGNLKNWNKSWVGVTQPGNSGSASTGISLTQPTDAAYSQTVGIKPGTAADAAFDGKLCNDVSLYTFASDLATDADMGTGTFAWLLNDSSIYNAGSLWFNGQVCRARGLVAASTNPAAMRFSSRRAGTHVSSADFQHPGTGNTLQSVEVGVTDSSGGGDIRLYVRGGSGSENGKTLAWAGAMVYRYDAARPGGFAAGSTYNTVSHAGWTFQNHVDRITEQALFEWYLATFPPTVLVLMGGHNASAAELTDLDGGNNGLVITNLITVARRHMAAADRARAALGMSGRTRVFFVTPWLSTAAGGLGTVARGIAWADRMRRAAAQIGQNHISLFDFFNRANCLMNEAHLHPDAANSSANTDIKTVSRALMQCFQSYVDNPGVLRHRP